MTAFEDRLLNLDRTGSEALVREVLATADANAVIEELIAPVLERIGQGWEDGRIALSQVYMSSRICESLLDLAMADQTGKSVATRQTPRDNAIAIAVLEDHHLLGKRIVASTLRASGWPVVDWGTQTVEQMVERVGATNPMVLLISTLMLPSALRVREVVDQLRRANNPVRIVVGGAPFRFDDRLWQEVGADACGRNAADALNIVETMMRGAI